jgi:hypothetical protein
MTAILPAAGPAAPAEWVTPTDFTLAETLARSTLVPRAFRGSPENILLAIMTGRRHGLDPATAMQTIHVIDGTPSLSAMAMLAIVRARGHTIRGEVTDTAATASVVDPETGTITASYTYTIDDAQRAGLAGKDNWKRHPKEMLWARAAAHLCRMEFPDIVLGLSYTAEELTDGVAVDVDDLDVGIADGVVDPPEAWTPPLARAWIASTLDGDVPDGVRRCWDLHLDRLDYVDVDDIPDGRVMDAARWLRGMLKDGPPHPADDLLAQLDEIDAETLAEAVSRWTDGRTDAAGEMYGPEALALAAELADQGQ